MKKGYRSRGLRSGALNKIGTAHIHVDGARVLAFIIKMVKILEKIGNPGKLNIVYAFIAGLQREILPETYRSHTPTLGKKEALDFFSSNLVKNRKNAIKIINFICKLLGKRRGVMIEMEQVFGWYENTKWQWIKKVDEMKPISSKEVMFAPSPSLPFEIHHGIDILKKVKGEKPPVSLPKLLKFCKKNNISVGGWFIFEDEGEWAYRSNSFCYAKGLRKLVEREQALLAQFFEQEGIKSKMRTLVEKVIGIWNANA